MSRYSKSLWTRRRVLGTGAAALAAPAIAPRRAWAAADEIRIGWVSPTTGPIAGFGSADDYVLGQLAPVLKEGIDVGGKHYAIKLIPKDNQSNPNRSAEVASQLILDDEVHLMLSSSSADTVLPVTDQCELNEVPSISGDTPWDAFFFGRGGDPATGFDWTYHFFWGGKQVVDSYVSLWDQLDTNRKVGLMMSNDSDGVAMSNPDVGFAAQLKGHGLEVIDLGLFEPLSDDYSAQIGKLKDAGVDIITGIFLPPDWTTFWVQAAQLGFRPKAATIAKALLFPSSVEALGAPAKGLSTEIWWSPGHPFASTINGLTSAEFAGKFTEETGRQWVQPMGFKHALIEVALDVLKRSTDPTDPGALIEAIKATDIRTIVGPINFQTGPVPNVSTTPVVGGQWEPGTKFPFDLVINENQYAPDIPVGRPFEALSY
ncbi:ABC transporter substrate-binding protein [Seohaeicola nanhaiensis]|uniref:ABC transporter substrate-binding protein n=1 Tax=Seohaeicola nanhaiensis TaxID=1387282 RepID=A0ABV9KAC5_9RHOB